MTNSENNNQNNTPRIRYFSADHRAEGLGQHTAGKVLCPQETGELLGKSCWVHSERGSRGDWEKTGGKVAICSLKRVSRRSKENISSFVSLVNHKGAMECEIIRNSVACQRSSNFLANDQRCHDSCHTFWICVEKVVVWYIWVDITQRNYEWYDKCILIKKLFFNSSKTNYMNIILPKKYT